MTAPSSVADTLIHARWVVPVVPTGVVLENYSVAISEGRITALMPHAQAAAIDAKAVIELPEQALLPGLINCHGHAAMTLLRGYADDEALMPWLENHIWPAEGKHVSERFVADGVELAIAEMIRSGTTTFSDMYFFPNVTAATAERLRMRCQITFPVFDFPTVWGQNADEYISKGLALRDDFKHSPLISIAFGPHAPYTVSHENLAKISTLAAELDSVVHIHLHETSAEVLRAVEEHGERPLDSLHAMGLIGPRSQCVHMTDLGDQDIQLLADSAAHVIHCPQSNMKLASGICPVAKLLERGVNVALGTDSAASNNDLNLFGEMQSAALLAKLERRDASALPASQALAMATINGARAMGREEDLGSIEVGKLADLISVDLSGPETQPVYHPLSQLVYACNGSQVSNSWIAGDRVMADRELLHMDMSSLKTRVSEWRARINGAS